MSSRLYLDIRHIALVCVSLNISLPAPFAILKLMPFASIPEGALEDFAPDECSSWSTTKIAKTKATSPWRPKRHRRRDQFHGDARARPHLPGARAGALRRAASSADLRPEHLALRHRVLRIDRRGRGRIHRNLRGRPRPHHSDVPCDPEAGPRDLARPGHLFRCAPAKAASWCAPVRPKRRWTWRASAACARAASSAKS